MRKALNECLREYRLYQVYKIECEMNKTVPLSFLEWCNLREQCETVSQ